MLEVTSKAYKDNSKIWDIEDFPCRFKVKPIITLTAEIAIPVHNLKDELSVFENLVSPHAWTGSFRTSPAKWKTRDGDAILKALQDAKENPVIRKVDPRKLNYRPKGFKSKIGTVSIPLPEVSNGEKTTPKQSTDHTEIQWMLLKLGQDMGFDVWVARNDKGREHKGQKFSDLTKLRKELPLQFDDTTNRTIELIDVLWLKGNTIVAAFEVESTTSIYSGLLRMSDLIAMQPNVNIPLYIVAPDERRNKVITEINRPTFSKLSPKLSEICRYISFNELRSQIKEVAKVVQYLKPEFLTEISESCEIEEV